MSGERRYLIWAPGVGYRTDVHAPKEGRWSGDINRARVYATVEHLLQDIQRGESDGMVGLEIHVAAERGLKFERVLS